jgi:hypothetical protein
MTTAQIQLAAELEAIKHRTAAHIRETLDGARRDAEQALTAGDGVYDGDDFEQAIIDLVMGDL